MGIVSEYNPLHTGHQHQIARARALSGKPLVLVCMSGACVQRGEFACLDKFTRARMAIAAGADAVIEMPIQGVLASADGFASASAGLMAAMGVDALSFGSEGTPIRQLAALAHLVSAPPAAFSCALRQGLDAGLGYAQALEAACLGAADGVGLSREWVQFALRHPNDTLAIAYMASAPGMAFYPVARTHPHDAPGDGQATSASHLRGLLSAGKDITPSLAPPARDIFTKALALGDGPLPPYPPDALALWLLRRLTPQALEAVPGMGEGLANRFAAAAAQSGTLADVLERVQTRRYPRARLRRAALCAMLGVPAGPAPFYARVLAIRREVIEVLDALCRRSGIPLVLQPGRQRMELAPEVNNSIALCARAHDLHVLMRPNPGRRCAGEDYTINPIISEGGPPYA
nr:nucleotidyltransferase family protein [bacterium]